jgi:hypothetical protein
LLSPSQLDRAAQAVRRYFAPREEGGFTGAYFERLGGGGDRPEVADVFTAEDLVAVSMLSVRIEGHAAVELLIRRSDRLSDLLRAVPTDVSLSDLNGDDLSETWAPRAVYRELRSVGSIGPTTASKLLARKRPHLVPVYDSVVDRELSLVDGDLWRPLHAWLVADGGVNERHLAQIRDRADVPDISLLRIFDVLAWMTGSDNVQHHASISTRTR